MTDSKAMLGEMIPSAGESMGGLLGESLPGLEVSVPCHISLSRTPSHGQAEMEGRLGNTVQLWAEREKKENPVTIHSALPQLARTVFHLAPLTWNIHTPSSKETTPKSGPASGSGPKAMGSGFYQLMIRFFVVLLLRS